MRRALPPLNSLRAFDALARLGSVGAAATELCVTPGAISHQIRQLEERLGVALFERDRRALKLSQSGIVYARQVREAFQLLTESTLKLGLPSVEGRLKIACAPALANHWLTHQLHDLRKVFGEISLELTPLNLDRAQAVDDEYELAIVYGAGEWEGLEVQLLTHFEMFPVCSPGFFRGRSLPTRIDEVEGGWLLHEDQGGHWKRWLAAAGARLTHLERGYRLGSASMALEAATSGAGIALGDVFVCEDALSSGRLVRLFDTAVRAQYGYYLVGRAGSFDNPRARVFVDWLESRLARTRKRFSTAQTSNI
ncbi:LysR substrate-binding domain-containing protein [Halotalea alkalilenta]|uniref:LysR substrate-binding domain-containing protein n=1 Tax=Halotalea alkalilenta TaxID=376489 RepID=UPI000693B056|nr:LysR substrate-binding domain-containing protein [Halotalea alkalilenta]